MTTATSVLYPAATVNDAEFSKEEVIAVIIEDATEKGVFCDDELGNAFYDMLERATDYSRTTGKPYILTMTDMKVHDVYHVVMRARDTCPEPGTAHALINAHFLDPKRGERSLYHTRAGADGCAAAIATATG